MNISDAKDIPIDQIKVFISRAREKAGFQELKASIADVGLLMPIQVRDLGRRLGDGKRYELICGEGRLTAAKQLGWEKISALVVEAEQAEFTGRFLAENMIRKSIPWAQKGRMIKEEMSRGAKMEEVAKRYHISPELAGRYVRVIDKIGQGLEEEISKMPVNDAEVLTKLPAAGQKIVIEIAKETKQSIKTVMEKADAIQEREGDKWDEASKATLRKALGNAREQLGPIREELRLRRGHYAIGPMNLERILRRPSYRKKLEAAGINLAKAEEAMKAVNDIQ